MSLKEERRKNNGPEARASCPVESCEKTEEAADKAVKKVFAIFGVDVDVHIDLTLGKTLLGVVGVQSCPCPPAHAVSTVKRIALIQAHILDRELVVRG